MFDAQGFGFQQLLWPERASYVDLFSILCRHCPWVVQSRCSCGFALASVAYTPLYIEVTVLCQDLGRSTGEADPEDKGCLESAAVGQFAKVQVLC